MIEHELKARISIEEARAVEERMLALCAGQREVVNKYDTYFHLPSRLIERSAAGRNNTTAQQSAAGHSTAEQQSAAQHSLTGAIGANTIANSSDTVGGDPNQPHHIRVRHNGDGACICTVKEHATSADGAERNREAEFSAKSYYDVCAALRLFGFTVDIEKRKTGYAYRYNNLLIEVLEVAGLSGRFVEIEHLAEEHHARQADAPPSASVPSSSAPVPSSVAVPSSTPAPPSASVPSSSAPAPPSASAPQATAPPSVAIESRLWEMLDILHIPRACVEPRRYIDLLRMTAGA